MKTKAAAAGPLESRETNSALEQMGRELLREAFARENALAEMNLDAIGRVLEENGDEIADADPDMQESYSRCKDLYCLLLLEAEGAGDPALLKNPIGAWAGADAAPASPSLADLGDEHHDPEEMTSIQEIDLKVEDDLPLPVPHTAPALKIAESVPVVLPSGARAKEYCQVAKWLDGLRDGFPFSMSLLDRLVAQNYCLGVELECQDRLSAVLKPLWGQRRAMISTLLRAKDEDLKWPEPIRTWLESLPHTHPEHSFDMRFPTTPALHSLRYLYALDSWEDFRPSLLDAGIVLLLFGQNLDGPGIALRNPLNVEGMESREVTETGLRLLRLQRLRNLALTPGSNIEVVGEQGRSLRSLVEEDAHAVLPLVMRCLNTED